MAKLFIQINQQLRIENPSKDFCELAGSENPDIKIQLSLLSESGKSSCGFVIDKSSILEGTISIDQVLENACDVTLKAVLAKITVYEMHLSALERKDVLVVSGVSMPGSALSFEVIPLPSSNEKLIKLAGENRLVASCVSIGSKKKDLQPYNPKS